MAKTSISGGVCDAAKIDVAIIRQQALIEHEINIKSAQNPTYMNDKIRDGGKVEPHDNGSTLISKMGVAGARAYNQLNTKMKPLVDGSMEGLPACSQQTVRMGTQVVDVDPNACEGVELVDFANGFYFRGCEDYELKLATRLRCKEQLANEEQRFVSQIIKEERKNFIQTGILSKDHHETNLVIAHGEANASVMLRKTEIVPTLSKGGWVAPPEAHISIPWLEEYRNEIVRRKITNGHLTHSEGYLLEIELTRDAWGIAKLKDLLVRSGPGGYFAGLGDNIRINVDNKDEMVFGNESKMKGRRFETWNNQIRVVFVDQPIRGYLKPVGSSESCDTVWDFVRVMPMINVRADEGGEPIPAQGVGSEGMHQVGGIIPIANPDYTGSHVSCPDGSWPILELIPHVDKMSFVKHGLAAGVGPDGVKDVGVNFEVRLMQGAQLSSKDCPNFFEGYYQYAMRHRMRFCNKYPEYSGFIIHRREFMPGYDIGPDCFGEDPRRYGKEGVACADLEALVAGEKQGCNLDCDPAPAECTVEANITSLSICGDIPINFFGEDDQVHVISVCRDEECASVGPAKVDYEFADDTAEKGTHYEVVDANGDTLPATGSLEWEEGEFGCKTICVQIKAGLEDTVEDGGCCEDDVTKNDATFLFKLLSATGTTLGDCVESSHNIANYS